MGVSDTTGMERRQEPTESRRVGARVLFAAPAPSVCRALLLALLTLLPALACAEPVIGPEPGLKAAYIFNFLRFTEWRPVRQPVGRGVKATHQGLMLCVPADSPLLSALRARDGQTVNGHTLTVASYTGSMPPAHLCNVLLRGAPDGVSPPMPVLPGALTIADGGEPARTGAAITLVPLGRGLAFDIDTVAAGTAGIGFSSQLLKLARSVR